MRNEEKNYVIIALRLYLSGTSRKSAWCLKDCLLFVCLVTVSVFFSVFFFFVMVLVFGFVRGQPGRESFQNCLHSPFYNGECRVLVRPLILVKGMC